MVIAKMDVLNSFYNIISGSYVTFRGDCKKGLHGLSSGNVGRINTSRAFSVHKAGC